VTATTVEERLKEHGYELPTAPPPVGAYVPVLQTGNLVITSGQLPFVGKELVFRGKIRKDLEDEAGRDAARLCVINALAQIKTIVGDLSRVRRIVRVEGYVNSAPGFTAQPGIVNGASDLLLVAFGEAGRHTRIAVGVSELPLDAAVEIAVWAEVS